MLLWIVLAVFTALVMAVLLRPLARPAVVPDDGDPIAVLRDQLRELDRDREAGLLPASEAEAARQEIERRALAFSVPEAVDQTPKPTRSLVPILIVLVGVPGVALALYLTLGSPDAGDQPLASRGAERELLADNGSLDLAKARAALVDRLAKEPNSLEGWLFLAKTDAALGRPADVKHDFETALTLSQRDPGVLESYGEAVVGLAGGTVTPEADALFKEAVGREPRAYGARFDLGLERAQNGDMAGAIEDWRKIEQEAPPDAPWLGQIRDAVAQAQKEAASSGGQAPTGVPPGAEAIAGLPPGQRLEAIKGMVAGLAARLEQQPNDLEGWRRLARSYAVLGQTDQAEAAYRRALTLAPDDPDLKSQLAALTARGGPSSAPSGQ
jgi:cytochrome c-type biogenesis protein CcmH